MAEGTGAGTKKLSFLLFNVFVHTHTHTAIKDVANTQTHIQVHKHSLKACIHLRKMGTLKQGGALRVGIGMI